MTHLRKIMLEELERRNYARSSSATLPLAPSILDGNWKIMKNDAQCSGETCRAYYCMVNGA
jgi:hypothetical protein